MQLFPIFVWPDFLLSSGLLSTQVFLKILIDLNLIYLLTYLLARHANSATAYQVL
ncbi:MAG: hypothetical protein QG574_3639 [Cyanobacteriota bacterium erpe_2018_sw_21hr_WHONDRS-SW48-000092_B_bin.40]|jgi:hypothetical protein|nr:hypothetical protein [Cyanobacteriota bacterium erpe_2018_sw_21hr_WHONDRS-SW48-000092_B_bin.40]